MPDASTARSPSPLRPAPSRASTPLPGSFALTEDASTEEFDDGAVLLGGNPLRLFRITRRGHELVAHWRSGGEQIPADDGAVETRPDTPDAQTSGYFPKDRGGVGLKYNL